jgi:GTPase SAR1 family protein
MLVGNKIDLARTITEKEGKGLSKRFNIYYSETSAKTNEGVHEIFRSLATLVMYIKVFRKITRPILIFI